MYLISTDHVVKLGKGKSMNNTDNGVMATQPIENDNSTTSPVETNETLNSATSTEKSEKPVEQVYVEEVETTKESRTIPYERFQEVNQKMKEYERQVQELSTKAQLLDRLSTDPELVALLQRNGNVAQVDPIKAQAEQALREMGYAKVDEILPQVQQYVEALIEQREFTNSLVAEVNRLVEKYNGEDGMPKFDPEKVLAYMDEKGYKDPEEAYIIMNKDKYIDLKVKNGRGTAYSEKSGQPMASVELDNRKADLEEAKKTGNFEAFLMKWARPKS